MAAHAGCHAPTHASSRVWIGVHRQLLFAALLTAVIARTIWSTVYGSYGELPDQVVFRLLTLLRS
jgi:hypothetical protein